MPPGSPYRRLTYEPSVEKDRLGETAQSDWESVTPTLGRQLVAPRHYKFCFHANSKVTAWEDNQDVSMRYRLVRLRRKWVKRLSRSGTDTMASRYEPGSTAKGPNRFEPDSGKTRWIDTPGLFHVDSVEDYMRSLDEFVVGVGVAIDETSLTAGFGGLYFIVAIDLTPDKYRVWMSLEKRLDDAQLQGAMGIKGAGSSLTSVIKPGGPDFESFRYVPHDWQDYSRYRR